MRGRFIKPGFFVDPDLCQNSPLARILFEGLWCLADREGRLDDRPLLIKNQCLPYDDCDVDELLDELTQPRGPHTPQGFIDRYEVDGVPYIQIRSFTDHQQPHHKEPSSKIPAPDPKRKAQVKHDPSLAQGRGNVRAFSPPIHSNTETKQDGVGKLEQTSPSPYEHPFIGATLQDDGDEDIATFRQIAAILDVVGVVAQERALFALLDFNKKRSFRNAELVFEATQWEAKLGAQRKTPGARVSSFREWIDKKFEKRPVDTIAEVLPSPPSDPDKLARMFPAVYGKGAAS